MATIKLTSAAQANVDESGCDPDADVNAIRAGKLTRGSLLVHCLDGADVDRIHGWHDYVDAVCAAAVSEVTTKSFYDNSLKDEYAHEHVRAARAAGRAWAEREYEASEGASRTDPIAWYPTDADARPLVSFPPDSVVEDQAEREHELAAICNAAARKRWEELCG